MTKHDARSAWGYFSIGALRHLGFLVLAMPLATCAAERPRAPVAGPGAPTQMAELVPSEETATGRYLAGRHAETVREISKAADYIAATLKDDPDNFDLLNRAYNLMLADGRMGEAGALARRIVDFQPASPLAGLVLAIEDAKTGKLAEVERRLGLIPRTGANRLFVPLLSAWAMQGQGRTAAALQALVPLADNSGFAQLHDLHAAYINDLAGINDGAEVSYRAVFNQPNPPLRAFEAYGSFLSRANREAEAKTLYERYERQNPESDFLAPSRERPISTALEGMAEALFNVAGLLRQDAGGQTSLYFTRLAIHLRPEFPAAQVTIGEILDAQGRDEDAVLAYKAVRPDSPFGWIARIRLAETLNTLDRTDEATKLLLGMAEERPARSDAMLALAGLYRTKDRYADSAQAYDRAIARIPRLEQRHWGILYGRGIALERSKQWPRAEADFVRALELQPEQPDVMNYLAYSWVDQGLNIERALRMLERAVELRPNNGYIIDSLGWALYRMGRFPDAVVYLERAVELQPADATLLDHLGDAMWRVGRQAEARYQWERALQSKPDPAHIPEIQAKLARGLTAPSTRGG